MAGEAVATTGKIAALLERFGGQHVAPGAFTAACAGVWLHAQAGRIAAGRVGAAEGVIASDVIEALPAARAATAAGEGAEQR